MRGEDLIMENRKMWAFMMKMGSNMWGRKGQIWPYEQEEELSYHDEVLCDKEIWRKVTDFLPQCGINTLLIDVGEGIKLDSHPELANPGSWEKSEVKAEIARLKAMGITPIPKLNCSCCHDAWLKDYAYMVGTPTYYQVCKEVLEEVIDIFDTPEFFHLGLDEEREANQAGFPIMRIRSPYKQLEDANRLFDICKGKGVRPWMWLHYACVESFGGDEGFQKNIPKDVLISNWYYNELHENMQKKAGDLYIKLGEWGYDQIPTCSTWFWYLNARQTMRYCKAHVKPESIKGYLTAPWMFSIPESYYGLKNDAWLFGYAKRRNYPEEP